MTNYWKRFVIWFRGLFGFDSWIVGKRNRPNSVKQSKQQATHYATQYNVRFIRKTRGFNRRTERLP